MQQNWHCRLCCQRYYVSMVLPLLLQRMILQDSIVWTLPTGG